MSLRTSCFTLTALALATFSPAFCEELNVRTRVERYYKAWQKEEVVTMWEMLSPKAKGNVDSKTYMEDLKLFVADTRLVEFSVKQTSPNAAGTVCSAETLLTVEIKSENRARRQIKDKTRWVLIKTEKQQAWFLDDGHEAMAALRNGHGSAAVVAVPH